MTTPPEPGQRHPAVGPLVDEAAQLLDALGSRLAEMRARSAAPQQTSEAGSASEFPAPERAAPDRPLPDRPAQEHACLGWCPICRGAELLRGDRSEVTEKLLDTALLVVTTLRSLIPDPPDAPPPSGPDDNPPARPGVERIDIR